MNNSTNKQQRLLIIGIIAGLLIMFIYLVSTYTLVKFTGLGSDEKTVIIKTGVAENESSKNFRLKTGSKLLILKKSDYSVSVQSDGRESAYFKKIAGFFYTSMSISTKSQLSSLVVGDSVLECAYPGAENARIAYYACPEAKGNFELQNQSGQKELILSSLAEDAFDHEHDQEEGSSDNHTVVMKPTSKGFVVVSNKTGLRTQAIAIDGTQSIINTFENFDGSTTLNDKSVDSNPDTEAVVVYESSKKTIWFFKNSEDKNPTKIPLDSYLKDVNPASTSTVSVGKNTIFLSVTQAPDSIEDHSQSEGESDEPLDIAKKASGNQKVLVINPVSKDIRSVNLEDGVIFSHFDVSADDMFIAVPIITKTRPTLINSSGDKSELQISSDTIQSSCWASRDQFIYSSQGGKIYSYDIAQEASFLVYQNQDNPPSNVSCSGKQLFASISYSGGQDPLSLLHLQLKDPPFKEGRRLESILPYLITYNVDTYSVTTRQGKVIVGLEYDSNNNGASDKKMLQEQISSKLRSDGYDTAKYPLEFVFNF